MDGTTVTMASLASIASGIGSVATWFWGVFTDLINTIVANDLMLWPVILAIAAGAVGLAIKVIRKFGIKGRR